MDLGGVQGAVLPPGVGAEGGVALGATAARGYRRPELAGQVVIADGEGYDALGVALEGVLAGDEHHAAAVKVEQIVVHHALQVGGVDPVEEQAVCFVDLVDEADDGVPGRVSDAVPQVGQGEDLAGGRVVVAGVAVVKAVAPPV